MRSAFLFSLLSAAAFARPTVVATQPTLQALAQEIGGEQITVKPLAPGFDSTALLTLYRADLLLSLGLPSEAAWLRPLVEKSRNPLLGGEKKGEWVAASILNLKKEPGRFDWDSLEMAKLAQPLAQRLAALDESHRSVFSTRALALEKRLQEKNEGWRARVQKQNLELVLVLRSDFGPFLSSLGLASVLLTNEDLKPEKLGALAKEGPLLVADEAEKKLLPADMSGLRVIVFSPEPGLPALTESFEHWVDLLAPL